MKSPQSMIKDLARKNPALKRVLVAAHDIFIDQSVPMSYKFMRGICRVDFLRRAALAIQREPFVVEYPPSELIHGNDPAHISAALREDGLAIGLTVDDSIVNAVRSYCARTPAVTDKNESIMVSEDGETAPIAGRFLYRYKDIHLHVPAVAALARDPLLVAIATEYIGKTPVLLGARAWWSYPPPPSASQEQLCEFGFHYDIDDYKFLKLFVHLNDVDFANGPHVSIRGTHKSKSLFEKSHRRISDEVADQRYGKSITIMTGGAGTAFLEDTFCYHKGTFPHKKRMILEIQWGTRKFD